MKTRDWILLGLAAVVLVGLLWSRGRPAAEPRVAMRPTPAPASNQAPGGTTAVPLAEGPRVPHYHASLEEAQPLPRILPASQFRIPVVAKAYRIAARIPGVLAQQPCYCWCDRMGHGSLVDCFATEHGASCAVCVQEAILAEQMTRRGKTPKQIREAIVRGDWEKIPLE
jgi:hypothetical protein